MTSSNLLSSPITAIFVEDFMENPTQNKVETVTIFDIDQLASDYGLDCTDDLMNDILVATQNGGTPYLCLCPLNQQVYNERALIVSSSLSEITDTYEKACDSI